MCWCERPKKTKSWSFVFVSIVYLLKESAVRNCKIYNYALLQLQCIQYIRTSIKSILEADVYTGKDILLHVLRCENILNVLICFHLCTPGAFCQLHVYFKRIYLNSNWQQTM